MWAKSKDCDSHKKKLSPEVSDNARGKIRGGFTSIFHVYSVNGLALKPASERFITCTPIRETNEI